MPDQPGEQYQVAGLPVFVGGDAVGFYVTVTFQSVYIFGSPLVVQLDPPVSGIENISLPATLGLIRAIIDGATFQN